MTGRRIIVLCALVMAVCAVPAPAAALADSMSVAVSNGSPPTGTPVTVTVTTNASPIDTYGDGPYLYVDVQPSSAGGCLATYGQDMQVVGSQADRLTSGSQVSTGSVTTTYNATEYAAGPYTVCTWLENTSNDYPGSSVTSANVTANGNSGFHTLNTDTLAGSLSNPNPQPHVPISVQFGGAATPIDSDGDGPYLYAVVQPATAGICQSTFGGDIQVVGDQATQLASGNQMSTGQFTDTFNFSGPRGSYRVCGWLEDTSNDYAGSSVTPSDVLATAVPIAFRVGSPPPPACVVPSYRGATLATVKRRLHSAHCAVGHIRRIRDHHVRRNHVVRLSSSPGTRLPHGARVGITVSRG